MMLVMSWIFSAAAASAAPVATEWLTPDFKVMQTKRAMISPLATTNGCRDQIASRICLVSADSMDEEPLDRVCEPGAEVYAQSVLDLYDRYPAHLQKMFCFVQRIFIEQAPGSIAYAGVLRDGRGQTIGGVVGIGRTFMQEQTKLDTLMSWKEQLNFGGPASPISFSPALPHVQTSLNGDFVDTLYYVLAHEFGHLLDFANRLNAQVMGKPPVDSWTALSWAGYRTPLPSESFALRKDLCFYSCQGTSLTGGQQEDLFQQLKQTNFTSTYSATNPFEDFAETFALYTVRKERAATFQFVTGTPSTYDLMDKLDQPIMYTKVDYIRKFLSGSYRYPGQP